jgi:Tol biopolymer transport system component
MDFGLARATQGAINTSSNPQMTQSPTVAQALTGEGKIVGTFQYMSPEQLEGREADGRSDIWALGCVLYEMATGRKPFTGQGTASLIASIMKEEPRPLTELIPLSPPALERIVKKCLAKDPDDRWQTARDLGSELKYIGESTSTTASHIQPQPTLSTKTTPRTKERAFWIGALTAAIAAAIALQVMHRETPAPKRLMQFSVTTPYGVDLVPDAGDPSISPDGTTIAFTATDTSGVTLIWVRPLDSADAKPLNGTDNAFLAFWSPDSKYLAYFGDGKLKKIRVEGGPPEVICDANNGRGGSWGKDGTIVFTPAAEGPIYKVSSGGGTPAQVTTLDAATHETGHRWACFLPDGKHFTYVTLPGQDLNFDVYVASIDGGTREKLFSASSAPTYAEPGYLLFIRNGTLTVQGFNANTRKLNGEPTALKSLALRSDYTGSPFVKASMNGTLIHRGPVASNSDFNVYNRQGQMTKKLPMAAGRFEDLSLSPDGKNIVVNKISSPTSSDLWIIDVDHTVSSRFTFGAGESFAPVWSPDGQRVAFGSNRGGRENVYVRSRLGQSAETLIYESNGLFKHPCQWSPDGREVLVAELGENTGWDILRVDATGRGKAVPLLNGSYNEAWAAISPNGRWVAYATDESGRAELYVDSYPVFGNKVQVSNAGVLPLGGGGGFVSWAANGRELLYETPDFKIMAVDVETSSGFRAGTPHMLFRFRIARGFTASSDGQSFVATLASGGANSSVSVVMNWPELLKH